MAEQTKAGGSILRGPLERLRRVLTGPRLRAGRLATVAALLAMLAILLPWPAFSYLACDAAQPSCAANPVLARGASGLLGTAGGLEVADGALQASVASAGVWAVIALLAVGAVLCAFSRAGAAVLVAAVLVYLGAVHMPLAAAGYGLTPRVDIGFGVGFWIALVAAGAAARPAAAEKKAALPRARESPPGPGLPAAPSAVGAAAGVPGPSPRPLLEVRNLTVRFFTYDGVLKALDGVTFDVKDREILGIVGETGCGKSVTAKAILRLIPDPPGRITGGEVLFSGLNLLEGIEDEARIRVNARGRARIRRRRRIARRMEALMRTVRGNEISMIFQEPTAALNPVMTVGDQIGETFFTHQTGDVCERVESTQAVSGLQRHFYAQLKAREAKWADLEENFRLITVKRAIARAARASGDEGTAIRAAAEAGDLERASIGKAVRLRFLELRLALWRRAPLIGKAHLMGPLRNEVRRRVVEMLKGVDIPDPERKADSYPFELSGGMQQRAMIAMALACRPRLLLADEPTTALDVTIQAQILNLIRNLRDQFGSSIILITHDLGVVAETCERVGVMYAGVMAEIGAASDIFNRPKHPYTVGLMRSIPETYTRTGKLSIIPGNVPSLLTPPPGCRFHPRCPFAGEACKQIVPALSQAAPGHFVACHLYDRPEVFDPAMVARRDAGLSGAWEQAVAR